MSLSEPDDDPTPVPRPADDPVAMAIARKLKPKRLSPRPAKAGSTPESATPAPANPKADTTPNSVTPAATSAEATAGEQVTAETVLAPVTAITALGAPAITALGAPATKVPATKKPASQRPAKPAQRAQAPRRKKKPSRVVAPTGRPGGVLSRGRPLGKRVLGAFQATPAYGIAATLHLVVLLVLSFWTIAVYHQREVQSVAVKISTTTEVIVESESDATALSDLLQDPELTLEVDSSDPFQEALGVEVGPLQASDLAIGLAGAEGGGSGRGGDEARRGGASGASDGSVNAGLEWLVRHRTKAGAWHALPERHKTSGKLGSGGEVARTGLAILCFLAAGQDHVQDGPYRAVVADAVTWLRKRTDKWGAFKNDGHPWSGFYRQAIGTLALSEALARQEDPKVRDVVTRAVAYLERTRSQYGWRYQARTDTDTSVTSWVTLALKSAEAAGVAVDPACFEGVRGYLEAVSTQQGTTGYTSRSNPNPAMNATGLFLRIMLGEAPTALRNRAAARRVVGIELSQKRGALDNLYDVYYAALAMYQVGGDEWASFNPRIRDALIAAQSRSRGHEGGSWGAGGYLRGRILSTCFAILTLETYYRYLPVHEGIERSEPTVSPARELLGQAALSLERARERGDGGSALAAEAAYQAVLDVLGDEDSLEETRKLELEARSRLVEIALLQQDEALALKRAEDYLQVVPRGQRGEPGIRRLALLGRYKQLMARARGLFGPGKTVSDELVQALQADVEALQQRLVRERDRLGNQVQDVIDRIGPSLDQLQAQLVFQGDPEQALRKARVRLAGTPAEGPVGALEVRAMTALLQRAAGAFDQAAREADAAAMERGEVDLEQVRGRNMKRLSESQAKALDPLYEQVMLGRLGAMLGLGKSRALLQGIAAFRVVRPGRREEALEGLERAALAVEVSAGSASPTEAARLEQLVVAWAQSDPQLDPPGRLALADALLAASQLEQAASQYERVVSEAEPERLRQAAHLSLADIRRRQCDLVAAQQHLAAITGRGAELLEVRLERCLLLRAQGLHTRALEDYMGILRALGSDLEAGEIVPGRRFLDGLRQLDPSFGGDEIRKDRFIELMIELDKRG